MHDSIHLCVVQIELCVWDEYMQPKTATNVQNICAELKLKSCFADLNSVNIRITASYNLSLFSLSFGLFHNLSIKTSEWRST